MRDLTVREPGGRALVDHVSFQVHAGEIVGIAGVQGNGQTELVDALVGLRRIAEGRVALQGTDITEADPRDMHRHGVAHIPEDRQREGIVKDFDVTENLALTAYYTAPLSSGVSIDWGRHARKRPVWSTSSTSARRRSPRRSARCPAATSRR
ncbi:MAG: ATP-binding cassette domain-containing protein [Ilumatobacteraceae bacterium]